MSTRPKTIDPTTVLEQKGRSRDDSQSADRGSGGRPATAPERLPEKRYFRIARVADTAIGVVALLGGFLAATSGRMPAGLQEFLGMRLTVKNLLLVLGYAVVWRLICVVIGLYDERRTGNRRVEALRVIGAVTSASAVALIFPLISVTRAFSHVAILFFWLGSTTGMLLLRAGLRALLSLPGSQTRDVLIVGSGPRALSLYRDLSGVPGNGFRVLGFMDSSDGEVAPEVQSRMLGDLAGLEQIIMRQAIDEVLIALPVRSRYVEIQRTIEICERGGVPSRCLADVFRHRRNDRQQLATEP